jgi:hypothetical protein
MSNPTWRPQLRQAIEAGQPLEQIVALLQRCKAEGVSREEVSTFLESLRSAAADEATDDRILEVSDFVGGFCSPHMKVWDE